jgi:excisionase family DNA binding protein
MDYDRKQRMAEAFGLDIPPGPAQQKALLTVADAARILRVTLRTIHQLCREGRLAFVLISQRKRCFTQEQIDDFIAARIVEPPKKIVHRSPKPSNFVDTPGAHPSHCRQKGGDDGKSSGGLSRTQLREEMRQWQ